MELKVSRGPRTDLARVALEFLRSPWVWDLRRRLIGVIKMYIELGAGGRILAAYLDQQYPGQRWLPIDSRALQTFLATAPTVAKDALGRRGFRRLWRSGPAYHVAA